MAAALVRSIAPSLSYACRITTRSEIARRAIVLGRSCRRRHNDWRAACCCSRPAFLCYSWARNTASKGRFRFSARSAIQHLIEAVRRGRREEFAALQFAWGSEIPDPQNPETFSSAKLTWSWPEGSSACATSAALSRSSIGPAQMAGIARPTAYDGSLNGRSGSGRRRRRIIRIDFTSRRR